jgi:ATP-dependent DNA helicase RecG
MNLTGVLLSFSPKDILYEEKERKRKERRLRMAADNENPDIEFKEIYTEDIKREVIAFANTEGGVLFVGIGKDGTVVGVKDPDDTMLRISGSLHDCIKPDIIPFVQIRTITRERKNVVEVDVSVGTGRPYYISRKGLRPEGVYVRRGSATLPLSDEGIRKMIADNYGSSFEERRSVDQNLTFETFRKEMSVRGLKPGAMQMKTLQMTGEDGLYTNLGLLLSDQCPFSLKAAVFEDAAKEKFLDRKEFNGSLLKQLEDCFAYMNLMNRQRAEIHGLRREDRRDYPEEAIREALLNAVVHRDYSMGGSSIVNIYEDRMEFISLGGLIAGLSMDAVFMGASLSRNPGLAAVFYRMKLIESYGTGIVKIRELCRKAARKPAFETAPGAFRVILYKDDAAASAKKPADDFRYDTAGETADADRILGEVNAAGYITRKQAETVLGSGQTKAYRVLNSLVEEGRLDVIKAGRKTVYRGKR